MTDPAQKTKPWTWRHAALAGALLVIFAAMLVLLTRSQLMLSKPRIEVDQLGSELLVFDWERSWKFEYSNQLVLVIECRGERYTLGFHADPIDHGRESFRVRGMMLPVGPCAMFVEKRDPFSGNPRLGTRVSNTLRYQWPGTTFFREPSISSPFEHPKARPLN